MTFTQTPKMIEQVMPSMTPIDSAALLEHGESPTAIILAIAILISVLVGSITCLVKVIVLVMLQQPKKHSLGDRNARLP
jgi:hypothetical protein